jgi:hypothetical protein
VCCTAAHNITHLAAFVCVLFPSIFVDDSFQSRVMSVSSQNVRRAAEGKVTIACCASTGPAESVAQLKRHNSAIKTDRRDLIMPMSLPRIVV